MSVNCGWPSVSVPVLSSSSTSARARASRYLPPLISNPRRAAAPMEASIAIGVASANEQEQATTSTAAVASGSRRSSKVSAAMPATTGKYQAEKRSAMRCTSARCASASSTSRITARRSCRARRRVARTRMLPSRAKVAANTRAPGPTSTGSASPVMAAWSPSPAR